MLTPGGYACPRGKGTSPPGAISNTSENIEASFLGASTAREPGIHTPSAMVIRCKLKSLAVLAEIFRMALRTA